jgi:hypothetical protein
MAWRLLLMYGAGALPLCHERRNDNDYRCV